MERGFEGEPSPSRRSGIRRLRCTSWRGDGSRDRQQHGHLTIGLLRTARDTDAARPTECVPCLGKPVLSMIHASIGPCRSIEGSTIARTLASTFSSDQVATPTRCSKDWCCAAIVPERSSQPSAPLALTRQYQPGAIVAQRVDPIRVPEHARKVIHIRRKSCAFAGQYQF